MPKYAFARSLTSQLTSYDVDDVVTNEGLEDDERGCPVGKLPQIYAPIEF